jgi:hypothetical protein
MAGFQKAGIQKVEEIAQVILDASPDPVVDFRLKRDVLGFDPNGEELLRMRGALETSRWVKGLKQEQEGDGGWGRFHSRDYTLKKKKIITTEVGIERGLALGLDASHPVFDGAVSYLSGLLEGEVPFPDPPERNDRWPVGIPLIVASTLVKIHPHHSAADEVWALWVKLAGEIFSSGTYDPDKEISAHRELTGASVKNSYLVYSNRYTLNLVGSKANLLPPEIEGSIVDWVWRKNDGVNYLGVRLSDPPVGFTPSEIDRWFTSMEILSIYPSWRDKVAPLVDWLWGKREEHGLWDFGPRSTVSCYFPLSESWRKRHNRAFDYSTRILALLSRYYRAA